MLFSPRGLREANKHSLPCSLSPALSFPPSLLALPAPPPLSLLILQLHALGPSQEPREQKVTHPGHAQRPPPDWSLPPLPGEPRDEFRPGPAKNSQQARSGESVLGRVLLGKHCLHLEKMAFGWLHFWTSHSNRRKQTRHVPH